MAMIRLAPMALHTAMVLISALALFRGTYNKPTGPAPKIATLSTAVILAILQTAFTATERGSIYDQVGLHGDSREPPHREIGSIRQRDDTGSTYIREFVA